MNAGVNNEGQGAELLNPTPNHSKSPEVPEHVLDEAVIRMLDRRNQGWQEEDPEHPTPQRVIARAELEACLPELTWAIQAAVEDRIRPVLAAKLINLGNPDERFTLNEIEDALAAALQHRDEEAHCGD